MHAMRVAPVRLWCCCARLPLPLPPHNAPPSVSDDTSAENTQANLTTALLETKAVQAFVVAANSSQTTQDRNSKRCLLSVAPSTQLSQLSACDSSQHSLSACDSHYLSCTRRATQNNCHHVEISRRGKHACSSPRTPSSHQPRLSAGSALAAKRKGFGDDKFSKSKPKTAAKVEKERAASAYDAAKASGIPNTACTSRRPAPNNGRPSAASRYLERKACRRASSATRSLYSKSRARPASRAIWIMATTGQSFRTTP